mmetsp:Transcript_27523/g.59145  ORF Transcript_27523/g.59145 Transcript_27523/m.59145 type:complete len:408 (-) Transcript_27523:86-1309(-)
MQSTLLDCAFLIPQRHQRVVNLFHHLTLTEVLFIPLLALPLDLPLNPVDRLLETLLDLNGRFPLQLLEDEFAVRVTSPDSHGSINVLEGHVLLAFVGERNLGEFIHRHHFGRSKVDGYITIRESQPKNPLYTIINKCERTSLFPISPNFKLLLGSDGLPAKGSRGLLASTLPRPPRSINIVESGNANIQRKVTTVCQSHLLGVKLLQTVHVLGTGWPRVALHQTRILGILLLCLIVNACRGGVKEVLRLGPSRGLKHVHRNGRVVKTKDRLVRTDKSHPAHIGGEVVNLKTVLAGLDGHLELAKIVEDEFVTEFVGFHEFILFPIDDGDFVSVFFEAFGDVRADEAGSASNADFGAFAWGKREWFVFGHGVVLECCCLVLSRSVSSSTLFLFYGSFCSVAKAGLCIV